MVFSACFSVGVMPDFDWSSVKSRAFSFRLLASLACRACCTVSFPLAVASAASPMIEFSDWLMALQAAVPVAGPVAGCGELAGPPAALGVLAALLSCEPPPLLLHPATAAAATAIAPMASLFLIACSPLWDGCYLGCRP